MPKYYFTIRAGEDVVPDVEGTEMPDADAARAEAILSAMEILAEKVSTGDLVEGQRFEIFDKTGALIAVVPFKDALNLA